MTNTDTRGVISKIEVEQLINMKINNCPFCGSIHVGLRNYPLIYVTCFSCNANGPYFEYGSVTIEDKIIARVSAWNNRTTEIENA